jgi:hypothetical protein
MLRISQPLSVVHTVHQMDQGPKEDTTSRRYTASAVFHDILFSTESPNLTFAVLGARHTKAVPNLTNTLYFPSNNLHTQIPGSHSSDLIRLFPQPRPQTPSGQ